MRVPAVPASGLFHNSPKMKKKKKKKWTAESFPGADGLFVICGLDEIARANNHGTRGPKFVCFFPECTVMMNEEEENAL